YVPVYKTFRGVYKHQYEFTFALAMLAGLGMTHFMQLEAARRRRIFRIGAFALSLLVLGNVVIYRFFSASLAAAKPPASATALTNLELLVPLFFFALSLLILWFSQRTVRPLGIALLVVLLFDLASYGHFFHWRTATFNPHARLQDPPAVQAVKQREPDLNSFRTMSVPLLPYDYTAFWPDDENYEAINADNISMLRGLSNVSGYDVLRPVRSGELSGSAGSAIAGFVQDGQSFGLADCGLDLLNVKYVLAGIGGTQRQKVSYQYEGIDFSVTNFGVNFEPGKQWVTYPEGAMASELALVTMLASSAHVPDDTPVLLAKLFTRTGRVIELPVKAGRDTAEWAYDRADVKAVIRHRRAATVESSPAEGFTAHRYLARLPFERAEIERIEWKYNLADASLYLWRASLYDAVTKKTTMLSSYQFTPERWRKLGEYSQGGDVALYENLRAMPRAWFVAETKTMPTAQVLQTIKTSRLPDGAPFDPQQTALLATEDKKPSISLSNSPPNPTAHTVTITQYQPHRIELVTHTETDRFLVLSEIYYAGWEARLAGKRLPLYRTDHALRGLMIPSGTHRLSLSYRPKDWRTGIIAWMIGMLAVLGCQVFAWHLRKKSRPAQSRFGLRGNFT
ncbi:MAG: hypothetical protein HOP19_06900, partial [Acidobacteria bacterium]|nr:hypothetical protein [Acidobacteriota bacterium]